MTTITLSRRAPNSYESSEDGEAGYLILFLCPLLLLALLFLVGSLKVIRHTLQEVALQSRLDVCAVDLAVGRKKLMESLVSTNRWVELTADGVAVARGVMLILPPLGAMGEEALLAANKLAALEQDAEIAWATAKEIKRLKCAANSFSNQNAFCVATPPLPTAFKRREKLFEDVSGGFELKNPKSELSRIRCMALSRRTELSLTGDPALKQRKFNEKYIR
ncbi:MAG: hypothetical protein ACXWQO_18585 [Bdellovibrionota bacterium]